MYDELKDKEILTDGQVYIYALLNENGRIKVGKTTNPKQRLESLGGSNSQGNKLIRYYFSQATWLHSLERTIHTHFAKYRIEGTEWFFGKDLYYEDVIKFMQELFSSPSYTKCNNLREQMNREKKKGNGES